MPGGHGWLAGFEALRPDDVTLAETINFDTAQRMRLRYEGRPGSITYANVGAATVIWSGISAEAQKGAPKAVPKAKAAAINARFGKWALRFDASRAPIFCPAGDLARVRIDRRAKKAVCGISLRRRVSGMDFFCRRKRRKKTKQTASKDELSHEPIRRLFG